MERIDTEMDDVAFLVTKRIETLSPDTRRILTLAACLGFSIDVELLNEINRREILWNQEQRVHSPPSDEYY